MGRRRTTGLVRRLAWFVALWAAGVLVIVVVAYGQRAVIIP